ncbi:hypothetical protein A148_12215 [Vibrio splendidus 1F-157]|uniref:hypothetical protein n=1 Tax=Vibrio splendidus TaxID=29497 RepID=UPI00030DF3A1|nr:hypothetical protein [Vibrio splendidus]OEF79686.1 hypothetical protein A148_12215 [Vibrio splendidus 1F-157]
MSYNYQLYSQGNIAYYALVCIFSLISVYVSVSIGAINPAFGIVFSLFFVTCLIVADIRPMILCFLVFVLLFKNISISLAIGFVESKQNFRLLLGIDFIIWFVCVLLVVIKFRLLRTFDKKLFYLLFTLLIYFLYGVLKNGPIASATYLRTLSMPLIMFLVTSQLSSRNNYDFLGFLIKFIVVFTGLTLLFEVFFTYEYYGVFNVGEFFTFKSSDRIYTNSEMIENNIRNLFNYFSIYQIYRPLGISQQPISIGYIFAIGGCFLFSRRNYFISAFCLLCILFLGSKGPLILMVCSIFFYVFKFSEKSVFVSLSLLLVVIIYMGVNNYDPHVYSVISTVIKLPSNIIGGGLGFGGVITTGTDYGTDFESVSGDSGFAVALNMMGVVGIAFFFGIYKFFMSIALKISEFDGRNKVLYYGICCLIVTGVIQEEALSAYSIGFFAVVLGVLYGSIPRARS